MRRRQYRTLSRVPTRPSPMTPFLLVLALAIGAGGAYVFLEARKALEGPSPIAETPTVERPVAAADRIPRAGPVVVSPSPETQDESRDSELTTEIENGPCGRSAESWAETFSDSPARPLAESLVLMAEVCTNFPDGLRRELRMIARDTEGKEDREIMIEIAYAFANNPPDFMTSEEVANLRKGLAVLPIIETVNGVVTTLSEALGGHDQTASGKPAAAAGPDPEPSPEIERPDLAEPNPTPSLTRELIEEVKKHKLKEGVSRSRPCPICLGRRELYRQKRYRTCRRCKGEGAIPGRVVFGQSPEQQLRKLFPKSTPWAPLDLCDIMALYRKEEGPEWSFADSKRWWKPLAGTFVLFVGEVKSVSQNSAGNPTVFFKKAHFVGSPAEDFPLTDVRLLLGVWLPTPTWEGTLKEGDKMLVVDELGDYPFLVGPDPGTSRGFELIGPFDDTPDLVGKLKTRWEVK